MARKRLACLNLWKLFMYTNYPSWPKSSVNFSYFLRSSWFTVGLVVASDRHISPYRDKSILIMAATSWSFKGDEYVGCDNIIQNRGCFMAEFCFYLHRITTFEIYFSGSSPVQNSELYKNWNDNCVFEAVFLKPKTAEIEARLVYLYMSLGPLGFTEFSTTNRHHFM